MNGGGPSIDAKLSSMSDNFSVIEERFLHLIHYQSKVKLISFFLVIQRMFTHSNRPINIASGSIKVLSIIISLFSRPLLPDKPLFHRTSHVFNSEIQMVDTKVPGTRSNITFRWHDVVQSQDSSKV
jgi:hypothetical protein